MVFKMQLPNISIMILLQLFASLLNAETIPTRSDQKRVIHRKRPIQHEASPLVINNSVIPDRPLLSQRKNVVHQTGHFKIKGSIHSHAPTQTVGAPWPKPRIYDVTMPGYYVIDPASFRVRVRRYFGKIVEFNLERFWRHVFHDHFSPKMHLLTEEAAGNYSFANGTRTLGILDISIAYDAKYYPTSSMDELYSLHTNGEGVINLKSNQVWGVIRGLDTLSQIIVREKYKFSMSHVNIQDKPRFPYRGVLIDTARHFMQKGVLIQNLEAMAQNKMNVFHWHIVDDHSFPFQSLTLPNITKYGAYEPTHIYNRRDIAEIIEEARLRGIRVIPEFDTPGHTLSWGYGQPGILTPCYSEWSKTYTGHFGPMHPLRNKTYEVLEKIFSEAVDIFHDYVHIGGDEVYQECWKSNPELKIYRRMFGVDMGHLLRKYSKQLQDIIMKLVNNRNGTRKSEQSDFRMISWQEAFDEYRELSKGTIIQIWKKDPSYIRNVLSQGYDALYSTCWYLDSSTYGIDWVRFYMCLVEDLSNLSGLDGTLLGGTVCLWTEYVDSDALITKLWPRASAAAERLWSPVGYPDLNDAGRRIEEQYCRLKSRGIRAGQLSGPGHCDNFTVEYYIPLVTEWDRQRQNDEERTTKKTFKSTKSQLPDMYIAKYVFPRQNNEFNQSYLNIMVPLGVISKIILCFIGVKLLKHISNQSLTNDTCNILSIVLFLSFLINLFLLGSYYYI